jgi:hypothetical protein
MFYKLLFYTWNYCFIPDWTSKDFFEDFAKRVGVENCQGTEGMKLEIRN